MVDYFGGLGYVCPNFTNPSDHMFMKVLNVDDGSDDVSQEAKAALQRKRCATLLAAYRRHPMSAEARATAVAPGAGIDTAGLAELPGLFEQVLR